MYKNTRPRQPRAPPPVLNPPISTFLPTAATLYITSKGLCVDAVCASESKPSAAGAEGAAGADPAQAPVHKVPCEV